MHSRQFDIDWWIKDPATDEWVRAKARWKNDQAILFYVFDRENPGTLRKLLQRHRLTLLRDTP